MPARAAQLERQAAMTTTASQVMLSEITADTVRSKGLFTTLQLSYGPGPGCPEPFYLSLGFRHTGRVDEGEIVLELPLAFDHTGAP